MYTVYILKDRTGKLYKGATSDIQRRLREHRFGEVITTSKMRDPRLVYKEEYTSWGEARKREVYLKSAAGRRFLKTKLPV